MSFQRDLQQLHPVTSGLHLLFQGGVDFQFGTRTAWSDQCRQVFAACKLLERVGSQEKLLW